MAILQEFFAEEQVEDLGDENSLPQDADEVVRLGKVLEIVKARVALLMELKEYPEKRARSSKAIGVELTPQALDKAITAVASKAAFIQNKIDLLVLGTEAKVDNTAPAFTAESRGYHSIQTLHYGADLLSLNNSLLGSKIKVY